jgi:hypothetical protein
VVQGSKFKVTLAFIGYAADTLAHEETIIVEPKSARNVSQCAFWPTKVVISPSCVRFARKSRVVAQRYNGFSTGGEILSDQEAICAAPLGLYFGICAAPQLHRIITALCRKAGAAQEIAERSKKSRTACPAVGRVFGKRVHETPMGLSQGVIG